MDQPSGSGMQETDIRTVLEEPTNLKPTEHHDLSSNVHAQSIENIKALIFAESRIQQLTTEDTVTKDGQSSVDASKDNNDDTIFKKPRAMSSIIKNLVDDIDTPNTEKNNDSSSKQRNYKIVDSNTNLIQNITPKRKIVDITIPDTGPKFYNINPPYCSATIVPKRLIEAFEPLPKIGRVDSKEMLVEKQQKLLREFVGNDIDDAQFKELEKYCSADNLRLGTELKLSSKTPMLNDLEEPVLTASVPDLDEGLLKTVDKCRMRQELDKKNLFMRGLKYRGVRVMPLHLREPQVKKPPANLSESRSGDELIFSVRFYRPFAYHPKERLLSNGRHPLLALELSLSGSSPLSLIREHLRCVSDLGLRVDVAPAPQHRPPLHCKDLFPSGFMFINNCFYVDNRPGCSDTSAVIRDWAKKNGIGEFPVRDMEVNLEDVPIKLGHPEVYVHQGNCEHLFTFSEVRIRSGFEAGLSLPAPVAAARYQAVYCTTCAEFPSKYLVTGCELVPFDPAMFCETCLQLYLYKDGKPIKNFKVYQYHYNDVGVGRQ